jgi:hypothetical protein
MENINICEVLVHNELLRSYDLFSTAFDTDYSARGTDTLGEKTKASLWTTANLDRLPSLPHTNLIKQPGGIMSKFVRLPLQSLLLCLSIS